MNNPISLALHGGAGTILKAEMSAEKEALYRAGLEDALHAGTQLLERGASALEAVEATVSALEDCPLFNAGRGSVFNAQGKHEMDASIMWGPNRTAGAVSGISGIKNPIQLARKVMENSGHVLLMGAGALEFAQEQGFELLPDNYFYDEFRYQQWLKIRGTDSFQLDHDGKTSPLDEKKLGTVGAVARDIHGHLAAATSTGGMTNKKYGRVGDSPVIGAGTWADDRSCAISCTGSGEFFLRGVVAYDVACLMRYQGMALQEACDRVIKEHLLEIGGDGGLIAVDSHGTIAFSFNTEGMYRARWNNQGIKEIAIYGQ